MAIIKNGRINLWNAVKKRFEVVHPETEVERITDFADGIVLKLALTSAMTAVTALQTDSWFGKLLKMVLKASGVRYNIANNGYVCFGSFFGGLIIQWGSSIHGYVKFPIAFTAFRLVLLTHQGSAFMIAKFTEYDDNNGFTLSVADLNGGVDVSSSYDAQYLAIGK